MTFKELTAAVQLISVAVVIWWVWSQVGGNPEVTTSVPAAATMLLWAIGISVVFNIAAMILGAILVSIAQRAQMKDERADERDRSVNDRSMRNGYLVMSVGALVALLVLAFGNVPPVTAAYALFAAAMLGGAADALSRLVYYRIG
jgi:predicted membrane protein